MEIKGTLRNDGMEDLFIQNDSALSTDLECPFTTIIMQRCNCCNGGLIQNLARYML